MSAGITQHELPQLNTCIPEAQNRRLDHRRADGFGIKVEQGEDAIQIYIAIFNGYGDLTVEQCEAIREYLDRT